MSRVYFFKLNDGRDGSNVKKTSQVARELLEKLITEERIDLREKIPLKVHFGEKGNVTFVKPENFDGIIDFLQERNIETSFIETNVLYDGQRHRKDLHLETAQNHGFSKIPVIIADGESGENYNEIEIDKKHFKTCKLGGEFSSYDQIIVISHFKGHMMAGFGGAIKQLSMGFASRGGKLAMHAGSQPKIKSRKCKKCNMCVIRCKEEAIVIGKKKSYIIQEKCVGCGACVAICPYKAITFFTFTGILNVLKTLGNPFREKLAEYALAAHKGKKNIYLNFAINITPGCDCEPKKMKTVVDDIGVFASTDPVAIDKACFDMVKKEGKKFRGEQIFSYAEKIGLGTSEYDLRS